MSESDNRPGKADEKATMRRVIREILAFGKRRVAASDTERRAHEYLDAEFQKLGLQTELIPFWTDQSLYRNLTFHFGLALAATWVAFDHPGIAFLLHLLVGLSYLGDTTKKQPVLRKLQAKAASQNLIAGKFVTDPVLRIALIAHADAAYTGFMFKPEVIRSATQRELPSSLAFLKKSLLTATGSVFVLALIDLLILADGPSFFKTLLLLAASIPSAIAFALNFEVVRRNEVVPGASDNLTGCAALLVLADRLRERLPANVEVVYVVTGAEEVGLCGADALRRRMAGRWARTNTIPVAVDTLSGGDLMILQDGEVVPLKLPRWLVNVAQRAAEKTTGLERVPVYEVPSGGTDAAPFAYDGYDAIGFGCVDPTIGAPRNYHMPSDTLENVDFDQVANVVDFLETFVTELIDERTGKRAPGKPAVAAAS